MCKGKGQESRDLHGKVRTIQPLWMACGVKQLLMRVFRAAAHPFQAHHGRQSQLLHHAPHTARDGCCWQSGLDGPFVHRFSTQ